MPHLLILSTEFPPGPGGIGTHAYEVARNLAPMGWQVTVVARQDYVRPSELAVFNQAASFSIQTLLPQPSPFHEWFYRWHSVAKIIPQADIVMVTGERMVWLAAAITKRYTVPWVAIGHGTEFGRKSFPVGNLTRWAFQQASMIICVSQYTQQKMLERHIKPRRHHIIPNGANANRFRIIEPERLLAFRQNHNLIGKRLLITVGHVSERKGQDIVIRALPRILEYFPNTHYLIVGLPTKQKDYEQLAYELNVGDHVHFLGRVVDDELVYYLNASDVFVMTSRYTLSGDFEGYGIAVVEAALCGKPAIVNYDSGLIEAIEDGKTGLGIPPESPEAVADAVIKLFNNPSQMAQFGHEAQTRALREQTWTQRVQDYNKVLHEILAR